MTIQEYIDVIDKYFSDKKINANVKTFSQSSNYITFSIGLFDITKLNKFNNAMQKELTLLIGYNVSIDVSNEIVLTINTYKRVNSDGNVLKCYLGKSTQNEDVYISFKNNPHWLVGGSTGSGKSVFLNNIITELITYYKNDIELAFIDLKKVELSKYNNLKMNVCDVANTFDDAYNLLNSIVDVMNSRYEKYKDVKCSSIEEYNKQGGKDRYLVCFIDELAELVLQSTSDMDITKPLQRILQLGRASGIFVICATQRPSNDVISGVLKVNFTTRICFKVANMYDSRTIINQKGGELLSGDGDGLILKNGDFNLIRFQASAPVNNSKLVEENSYSDEEYQELFGNKEVEEYIKEDINITNSLYNKMFNHKNKSNKSILKTILNIILWIVTKFIQAFIISIGYLISGIIYIISGEMLLYGRLKHRR